MLAYSKYDCDTGVCWRAEEGRVYDAKNTGYTNLRLLRFLINTHYAPESLATFSHLL